MEISKLKWSNTKTFFLLFGLYVSLGSLSIKFENFVVRDSIYFSIATFSRVGYGDIIPTSNGGKISASICILLAHGVFGIAIGALSHHFYMKKVELLKKTSTDPSTFTIDRSPSGLGSVMIPPDASSKATNGRKNFSVSNSVSHLIIGLNSISQSFSKENHEGGCLARCFEPLKRIFIFFFPLFLVIAIGSIVVGHLEKWTWYDSLYWCTMTGTTVGYGDFYPTKNASIWFCVFFIPVCVGCMTMTIARIANFFVDEEMKTNQRKLMRREVTVQDLETMNTDGNDHVDLLEFVEYFLVFMRKVDEDLLDELHEQFKKLDADGSGGLQKADLDILRARKMERKLDKKDSIPQDLESEQSVKVAEKMPKKKVVSFTLFQKEEKSWKDDGSL